MGLEPLSQALIREHSNPLLLTLRVDLATSHSLGQVFFQLAGLGIDKVCRSEQAKGKGKKQRKEMKG